MKNRWSWRERGVAKEDIQHRIDVAIKSNISYDHDSVLGFPGTTPLRELLDVHRQFAGGNPNNIGHHTVGGRMEFGFEGTQKLERDFIYTLAHLVGAEDPERDIDGYICMGGTEGNDHGLWIGRNKLRSVPPTGPSNGIAVITSFLAHYSIDKHFGRLFNTRAGDIDADVLVKMPTDAKGELDPMVVERQIRELRQKGISRFILVLTVGTTNMGSVDPVGEICEILDSLHDELKIETYVHIDAAFGGFVLPFLEPDTPFGFQNHLVDSMVVDAHKTGYMLYSAGVFMCRKGRLEYTTTEAKYVPGHCSTVCGSRSGAIAAACWALTQLVGQEKFESDLQNCMRGLEYLRTRLSEFNVGHRTRVKFYPTRMNIQAVWVDDEIHSALYDGGNQSSLRAKFCIPDDNFPADLTNLTLEGNIVVRKVPVVRFVAMPHYDEHKIDQFLNELTAKVAGLVR